MKIDLRKLYAKSIIEVDDKVYFPIEKYEKLDVKSMSEVLVKGKVFINYDDNIELDLNVKGNFIIPCAVSLEDVIYPFDINISEEITENEQNNEFFLDLLDILWENIVLEIPVRVVKEGVKLKNQKGNGWEVVTEE